MVDGGPARLPFPARASLRCFARPSASSGAWLTHRRNANGFCASQPGWRVSLAALGMPACRPGVPVSRPDSRSMSRPLDYLREKKYRFWMRRNGEEFWRSLRDFRLSRCKIVSRSVMGVPQPRPVGETEPLLASKRIEQHAQPPRWGRPPQASGSPSTSTTPASAARYRLLRRIGKPGPRRCRDGLCPPQPALLELPGTPRSSLGRSIVAHSGIDV
jgi:hypothetical protein